MYLSDRDLDFAVRTGQLIVSPAPTEYDTSGIDLHLDRVEEARVWNVGQYQKDQADHGNSPYLSVGRYNWKVIAAKYTVPVPEANDGLVYRDGKRIVVKPHGFFLWQTLETVGTPEVDPRLVCFIDGRSSIARAGMLVHMTAPTIHAGWWGQITLEIANLGPFDIALCEGDPIAQIVVAALSSPPKKQKKVRGIDIGQKKVTGVGPGTP